jgi:hypothetical protein
MKPFLTSPKGISIIGFLLMVTASVGIYYLQQPRILGGLHAIGQPSPLDAEVWWLLHMTLLGIYIWFVGLSFLFTGAIGYMILRFRRLLLK